MTVKNIFSMKSTHVHLFGAIVILGIISILAIWQPGNKAIANNHTYVTVHYDGTQQTLATDAKTVGELLDRADIRIDKHDDVQPSRSTELTSNDYNVNIYRARPVTVVDNGERYKVVTAAQSPKKMAEHAGIKVYAEDIYTVNRIDDFLSEGSLGLRVDIDRSIPLTLDQYGEKTQVRTQATTVSEFLSEKGLKLQEGDKLDPIAETPITKDMTIRLIQNGIKVITVEEEIPFETEQIQDAEKEVGFKEIQEPGENGLKKVTYEVVIENGIEVDRKELNSLEIKAAKTQREIVGTKPSADSLSIAKGVNYYTDSKGIVHRETYYDLPMNVVMGACGGGSYTVRADGAKVDKDGYILVAANLSRYPRCSIVETSMGQGKVYDTGGFALVHPDGFDLATDWTNNNGN